LDVGEYMRSQVRQAMDFKKEERAIGESDNYKVNLRAEDIPIANIYDEDERSLDDDLRAYGEAQRARMESNQEDTMENRVKNFMSGKETYKFGDLSERKGNVIDAGEGKLISLKSDDDGDFNYQDFATEALK
jgi:predicted  nucleic acid-binding Zn-ribbon protein